MITEPLPLGVKKLFLCGKFIMSVSDGEENVISSCTISDFEIWVTFYPHSSPSITLDRFEHDDGLACAPCIPVCRGNAMGGEMRWVLSI